MQWKYFPFKHTDDENESQFTIQNIGRCSLNDLKIFDQFEINGNDDNIIEYQGDLDPVTKIILIS